MIPFFWALARALPRRELELSALCAELWYELAKHQPITAEGRERRVQGA